jgi:hypothetical protein
MHQSDALSRSAVLPRVPLSASASASALSTLCSGAASDAVRLQSLTAVTSHFRMTPVGPIRDWPPLLHVRCHVT